MLVVAYLHRSRWEGVRCFDARFQCFSMCDDSFEVFDAYANMKLLFYGEFLKV